MVKKLYAPAPVTTPSQPRSQYWIEGGRGVAEGGIDLRGCWEYFFIFFPR